MRVMMFHLMSWPYLPDDLREHHESVWVNLDSRLYDPVRGNEVFNRYLDHLELADQLGFDAICVNEHHNNGYGLMPSPNLMAAALARRTSDAALCVLGNSLALYNPPVRVAEEFAMLDVMSGGRLIAGFPVGTPMDTAYCYSVNPSQLRERYYEAERLVIKAWTERDTFEWNGTCNQLRYVNIWPRPLQQPHPPVWIPGGGSVETWEFCARMKYVYCYLTYFGLLSGEKIIKGYWAKMRELGIAPNPFLAGTTQFVAVAHSYEEAIELYSRPLGYFFNTCLHLGPRFVNPPGYMSEETIRKAIVSQVQAAAARVDTAGQQVPLETFDSMVEKGWIIIGSPEQVAEKLWAGARETNVGNLMVLLSAGQMDDQLARYNIELFARKVMPELKSLFEEEWEHPSWPKPLAKAAAAPRSTEIAAHVPVAK